MYVASAVAGTNPTLFGHKSKMYCKINALFLRPRTSPKDPRPRRENPMKILKRFRLVVILSMLIGIFGCQTVTTESITVEVPTVETAQDEALSKSVRDRLLANSKADFDSVKIVS